MMADKIKRFEDMPVWRDSQDLAVAIYGITKIFPSEERYALSDQMRRASSSVSANIAEGFGRKSRKDMLHFYAIANGSLLETKNFVYLAARLEYIEDEKCSYLIESIENLQKQVSSIRRYFNNHE